jgi:hypothetical protein
MSALSILFKATDSRGGHGRVDGRLLNFSVFEQGLEPRLGGARQKIQTSA